MKKTIALFLTAIAFTTAGFCAENPAAQYNALIRQAIACQRQGDENGLNKAAREAMALKGNFDRRDAYYLLADHAFNKGKNTRDPQPEFFKSYLSWMEEAYAASREMGLSQAEAAPIYQKIAWKILRHDGRPWRDTKLARSYYEKSITLGAKDDKRLSDYLTDMERRERDMEQFPNREWRKTEEPFFADLEKSLDVGKTVHAKDFGWNRDDATQALQAAIDSEASLVIVDNMGSPWEVEGIRLRSNKKILLKKGAIIEAKKDAFIKCAPLIDIRESKGVAIVGEGDNVLRMRKSDYTSNKALYPKFADNRHGIVVAKAYDVLLRNFTVASSGGDGLVMTGESDHLRIDRVVFYDNYRQGITLGAGSERVFITNSEFNNTWGAEPMAGIDVEPWCENFHVNDVYVENCKFTGNRIYGLVIANSSFTPFTMMVKDCLFEGNGFSSLSIFIRTETPTPNKMVFEGCEFRQPASTRPIDIMGTLIGNSTFKDCIVRESGIKEARAESPLTVTLRPLMDNYFVGKTVFDNLKIIGFKEAKLLTYLDGGTATERLPAEAFAGVINFNGKKIDIAKYIKENGYDVTPPTYVPPAIDFAKLQPPPLDTAIDAFIPAPWGNGTALLYWAEKGRILKFAFFNRITTWTQYNQKDRYVRIRRPDGVVDNGGSLCLTNDHTNIAYLCPQTGFYKIWAPGRGFFIPSDDKIWGYAYMPDSDQGIINMTIGNFDGCFEVPKGAKKIQIQTRNCESFELIDARGETVAESRNQRELKTWTIPVKQDGIWRFRIVRGSIRFFEPLNGIFADAPANLPRMR